MLVQYIFSLVYLLSAIIFAALMIFIWRFRSAPVAAPLLAVFSLGGAWALCDAFYVASDSEAGMLFWASVKLIPISLVPLALLVMSIRHYKQSHWWDWRVVAPLLLIPALTSFFSCTNNPIFNERHWLDKSDLLTEVNFYTGPWGAIHIIYSYILVCAALGFFAASLRNAQSLYRMQTFAFMGSSLLPLLTDMLYNLNLLHLHDPAPLTFTVTGLINTWALLRYRSLDIAPIAHNLVIKHMADLMLVLDDKERVVDLNPTAASALGVAPDHAIGLPVETVLPQWREVRCHSGGDNVRRDEITLPLGGKARVYDLSVSTIFSGRDNRVGSLVLLRDITASKLIEANLREQLARIEDLQSQLREQAIRDSLTGLYNRRYLEEMLHHELARARRDEYPLSLIMVDIDRFKKINDTWGHGVGDRVLASVGKILMGQVREPDIVCRFGGEEFLLVLPNVSPEVAFSRAEECRKACQALYVRVGTDSLRCTISLGVATYPADGTTAQEVLLAADQALYAAKADGRNKTVQMVLCC